KLVHLGRPGAAGNALAAGFGHAELHEVVRHVHHAGAVVHDDHAAGAHDGTEFPERFIVYGEVEELFRDAAAGRSTGLHGLEFMAFGNAAANLKNDLAEGRSHGHLNQADIAHLACECKDLGTLAFLCADGSVPIAAAAHDAWDVGEGLHIVDEGGHVPKPGLRWIRRTRAGRATASLDGGDQGGFFTAHKGAAADTHFHVEVEFGVADLAAQEPQPSCFADG